MCTLCPWGIFALQGSLLFGSFKLLRTLLIFHCRQLGLKGLQSCFFRLPFQYLWSEEECIALTVRFTLLTRPLFSVAILKMFHINFYTSDQVNPEFEWAFNFTLPNSQWQNRSNHKGWRGNNYGGKRILCH